jgi:3-deoxy-D-manno-octulosonic-acid transferase
MHCASVGEFEQGRPILESMRLKYPSYKIVLSFFSPSGYELRKNYSGADEVIYLPLDTPKNAEVLLELIQPALVIWVKYEFWYHFLREIKKRNIPIILVSGIFRPSQPFFKWYGKWWRNMLNCFTHIFVQNQESMTLLQNIGLEKFTSIAGDTRFDRVLGILENNTNHPAIERFINNETVIIAGSTWSDDENLLKIYFEKYRNFKLIIAPHEINDSHLTHIKSYFPNAILFSRAEKLNDLEKSSVMIIDNVGMLATLYKYATIAYIGGGFNKSGIHNILEAAVYGKPVVFGPNYKKFQEANQLIKISGAFSIKNTTELEAILNKLRNDKIQDATGKISKEFVIKNAGASEKIMEYIYENLRLTN